MTFQGKYFFSINKIPNFYCVVTRTCEKDVLIVFQSKSIYPKLIGEFDDIALLQLVAQRKKCFTVLPKHAVEDSIKRGVLMKLGDIPMLHSDVWAVIRSQRTENKNLIKIMRG